MKFIFNNYFTHFLFLLGGLYRFTYYCNGHGYQFDRIEFYKSSWWQVSSDVFVMGSRLWEHDQPGEMCAAARRFISTPDENFENTSLSVPYKVVSTGIKFIGREDVSSPFEVVWCETTPEVWVRRAGTSGEELTLLMKFLPFQKVKNYSFDVEYVETDPTPCLMTGDRGSNRVLTVWNICEVASEHVSEQKPAVTQNSETILQFLQFEYIGRGVEKHIAVVCPSHPPMYVYYGDTLNMVKVVVKRTPTGDFRT